MSATVGRLWTPGMMSSVRQDWATPRALFEMLHREFRFELDVCAQAETATVPEFLSLERDALALPWAPRVCWMNPPYGRVLGAWVEKAFRESRLGATVVCLLPARTDTQWWHAYCLRGEIRFLRGRLSFDDAKGMRAPFPSVIVVFRKETI